MYSVRICIVHPFFSLLIMCKAEILRQNIIKFFILSLQFSSSSQIWPPLIPHYVSIKGYLLTGVTSVPDPAVTPTSMDLLQPHNGCFSNLKMQRMDVCSHEDQAFHEEWTIGRMNPEGQKDIFVSRPLDVLRSSCCLIFLHGASQHISSSDSGPGNRQ